MLQYSLSAAVANRYTAQRFIELSPPLAIDFYQRAPFGSGVEQGVSTTHSHHDDHVGGCCGMVISRADLTPFSAALGSKQHAFVSAAVVRRRVRQRECSSSALQQGPAATARRQLFTATTDYHGGANGAATVRERLTVGSVRVSSRSSNDGSGGNDRNRMMAAAKRRRWTEVRPRACMPRDRLRCCGAPASLTR